MNVQIEVTLSKETAVDDLNYILESIIGTLKERGDVSELMLYTKDGKYVGSLNTGGGLHSDW